MQRKNFFKELRYIKSCLSQGQYEADGKLYNYSKETNAIFNRLVEMVKACPFTNAKASKFVCENWDKSAKEMSLLGTESRAEETFRTHISNTSKLLYSLLPCFSADIFISESFEKLHELECCMDAMELSFSIPEEVFISEVCNYIDYRSDSCSFSLEECENEIALLRLLTKSNIYSKLDDIDPEKLSFLLRILNQKTTHIRSHSVNTDKVLLLKELGLVGSDSVFAEALKTDSTEVSLPDEREVALVSEDNTKPYVFNIDDAMFEILKKRLVTEGKYDDPEKSNEENIKNAIGSLSVYTLEGFKRYLYSRNIYDLKVALETYKSN